MALCLCCGQPLPGTVPPPVPRTKAVTPIVDPRVSREMQARMGDDAFRAYHAKVSHLDDVDFFAARLRYRGNDRRFAEVRIGVRDLQAVMLSLSKTEVRRQLTVWQDRWRSVFMFHHIS